MHKPIATHSFAISVCFAAVIFKGGGDFSATGSPRHHQARGYLSQNTTVAERAGVRALRRSAKKLAGKTKRIPNTFM